MIRNLLASLIVGLLAFAATSCSVDDLDTTGLQLSCEKGSCPSGWTCQDARCVPPDGELPGEGEGDEVSDEGLGGDGGGALGEGGDEGEGEGGVDPVVAASLRLVDVPAELAAGGAFKVTVEVVSEAGEIAKGFGGLVQIAVERDGVPIELTGVIELQAGSGVVVFDKLSLTQAGAGTVLVARSGELAEGRSNKFDVLPGPPAELRFLQEPTNARINQPILPLVQVGLVDEFGNASIGAESIEVNLALAVDPTGVAALGGAAANTIGGVATFPNLRLNQAGAGYHLSADAPGFSQRLSARFSVGGPGAPDLVITMGASGGFDIYEDIVADGSDGFIAIGSFAGDHRIGEDTITSLGGTDGIVVRFDAAGELLWATRFGGVEDDEGLRLSLTDGGDVLRIAGQLRGEASFERMGEDAIVLGRAGQGQRMFMATLRAASGQVMSALEVSDVPATLNDMACTLAGDCYLTGSFDRVVTLEGKRGSSVSLVPVNQGRDDAFFARFSASGLLLWAQAGGGHGDNDAGIAVTVDDPAFPTFVGTVDVQNQSRAIFGNEQETLSINSTQGIDVFVLRMTRHGAPEALLRFGGVGTDRPTAVLTTDSGLVVGGTTESGISFDHLPGTGARGGEDGFVLSTNFELEARWIRGIGGADFDGVRALGLAPPGELTVGIIVAGVFRGTLPVSQSAEELVPNLESPEFSGLNGYLLRLAAADGGLDWATSFDGLEATDPIALATSRTVASVSIHANSAVVLGRNQAPDPGRGRAGEQTIAGGGPPDAVVAHFDLIDGAYLSGGGYGGGDAQDVFLGVSALPDGGFLASGGFSGRAFIGQDERGDDVHMLTSGAVDGVIANYGPEGEVRWTAQAAGPDHSLFLQAFAAPDGQIAAAGIYVGAATFGSGEVGGDGLLGETFLGASERFSIFTSGLDSGGKLRWLKTASGDGILLPSTLGWSTDRSAMSLSGLASGDGVLRFGPGADEAMVVTPGQSAGFMATYAVEDGSLRRLVALPGEDGSVSIAASVEMADGGLVICGGWSGVLNIDGLPVFSAGQTDSYVARFSPQGDLAWLTLIYSEGGDDLSGLRVAEIDGELSVVIIGETDDDADLMFIKRAGEADNFVELEVQEAVFIARLDAGNGELIWVELIHAVGGSVDLEGLDIAGSRVAIAGYFYRRILVGRGQGPGIGRQGETALTTRGDRDMLVALYEGGDGALRWVRRVGGKEDQAGHGVALLPNGGVVAVGQFGGVAVVDGAGGIEPQEVDARDGHDGIVVRWLP